VYEILLKYIQIWHFYCMISRGLLFSWTQCGEGLCPLPRIFS